MSYDVTKPFSVLYITIEKVQNTHHFMLLNAGDFSVTFSFLLDSFVQQQFNKESLTCWDEKKIETADLEALLSNICQS